MAEKGDNEGLLTHGGSIASLAQELGPSTRLSARGRGSPRVLVERDLGRRCRLAHPGGEVLLAELGCNPGRLL